MGGAINVFVCIRALSSGSVNEKNYFTKTLLNIIHNFISQERIICDGRDPSWISICRKNTDESLDECNWVEMNADESRTNVDE